MHELSIADAVVEIALRHAAGRRVRQVELRIGHLRQAVPSALEFAFELLAQGTALEGAALLIEEVPACVRCRICGSETEVLSFPMSCGRCGAMDVEVVAGEELLVDTLELESEPEVQMSTGGMAHGG
jgi:hydrogenase nickel incorporation protein HypA/HybF